MSCNARQIERRRVSPVRFQVQRHRRTLVLERLQGRGCTTDEFSHQTLGQFDPCLTVAAAVAGPVVFDRQISRSHRRARKELADLPISQPNLRHDWYPATL